MKQNYFPELTSQTHFPEGHETFYEGIKRLAQEWFPKTWHGEDEYRRRHQEYDESVSSLAVEGARLMMAETLSEDELGKLTASEISDALKSERTDEHLAELEAPLRFNQLVQKLRTALMQSEISIIGLAHDGSDVSIPSRYWKGNLAEQVLYAGSCTIDDDGFVPRKITNKIPARFLIFDSESVDNYISARSGRPELSKDEVFSVAFDWLSREMRKSPSYRPPHLTQDKARVLFNKNNNMDIKERKWKDVWKKSISATGATAWSKRGPSKQR
ncbi:hypothetical protein [Halocynthiibacter namhaensis]|uniref:hypothetical protein n=1 Tax=Halocynthiibacter namhaensis TaxID=1290553 RepID=UPI0005792C38|nr:hypothetical protein [Halocynthiibacter namhaensis]